jgi:hypothetical protein
MLVPDTVLVAAGTVNDHLSNLYGILRRIDIDEPEQGETIEAAAEVRRDTWEVISEMRIVMRRDLGIAP